MMRNLVLRAKISVAINVSANGLPVDPKTFRNNINDKPECCDFYEYIGVKSERRTALWI